MRTKGVGRMVVRMRTHFGAIWEAIADAVPQQAAVVQGDRRVRWRDYEQRAARMAQALVDAGVGPGSKVGMYLYNSPEYCETNFAAMKVRGVPINVNYRYLDDELHYLLDNADIEALVFHTSLGDRVARVRDRLDRVRLLVEVDDGPPQTGLTHVEGAVRYEELQATVAPAQRIEPRGDELYIFYTGGTTGMPKGVMYPLEDFTDWFLRCLPSDDRAAAPRTSRRAARHRYAAVSGRYSARRHVGATADARHRLLAAG